jgi:hypothetical protein
MSCLKDKQIFANTIQSKLSHCNFFDEGINSGKTQDFSEMVVFKFLLKKISTLLHELEEDSIGE